VKKYRISFIGAGKVAGALSRQLYLSGYTIQKIISRTEKNGRALALSCNALWSSELSFVATDDVFIVAVPDDSLREILKKINCRENTVVAHTAGSHGLDVFPARLKHTGIFYPLQTFSKNRKIEYRDLPFFLEASDAFSSAILKDLTESVGGKAHFINTEQRRLLHVAAVFVCNFTNHMFTAGRQITEKAGLPFDVLKPLINETVLKALEMGPENSQTGPAYRSDKIILKKHIDLLSFSPELQGIYREITESIIKLYKNRT
jgi:predicted short-subunit dehydrogenase-like oxidoreductase (DUF2520 family)